jgi:hypothetical protein
MYGSNCPLAEEFHEGPQSGSMDITASLNSTTGFRYAYAPSLAGSVRVHA